MWPCLERDSAPWSFWKSDLLVLAWCSGCISQDTSLLYIVIAYLWWLGQRPRLDRWSRIQFWGFSQRLASRLRLGWKSKNKTWPRGGSNWPPLVKIRYVTKMESNWPPLVKKCYVTKRESNWPPLVKECYVTKRESSKQGQLVHLFAVFLAIACSFPETRSNRPDLAQTFFVNWSSSSLSLNLVQK